MISFPGYESTINKVYNSKNSHVFDYWDKINKEEKKILLEDLKDVDFDLLKKLHSENHISNDNKYHPAPYISLPENAIDNENYNKAKITGLEYIKSGKVSVFIVAGGQGSRLGFNGPKGKFPTGAISNKTLFELHGEKILKYSEKYGITIPWYVMTSKANNEETCDYFKNKNFFGLTEHNIKIFSQNMIPSISSDGKLILQNEFSLFKNPDGHGGSLTALESSGSIDDMKTRGIELISYFQVDNPLVKIIDPVFIGFHRMNNASISSKAVKKSYADEKVGVFVEFDNKKFGVIEYSDMPEEKIQLKDDSGILKFNLGSIAIHLFNRNFIEEVTSGTKISLPYHAAKKKIKAFSSGKTDEIDGIKYEKFVFDALNLTKDNIIFETSREEEFAPIKNPSGVDSIESARNLMSNLYKKWLKEREVTIPDKVEIIEISPLLAVEAEDIISTIVIDNKEGIYLD
jgi:UDP-N-acetylglucosamine pyrophosphorylase